MSAMRGVLQRAPVHHDDVESPAASVSNQQRKNASADFRQALRNYQHHHSNWTLNGFETLCVEWHPAMRSKHFRAVLPREQQGIEDPIRIMAGVVG